MSMFCYQCQETAGNKGCAGAKGACGKPDLVSNLQDAAIHALKGLAWVNVRATQAGACDREAAMLVNDVLFATLTNVNFDPGYFADKIHRAVALRERIKATLGNKLGGDLPEAATWDGQGSVDDLAKKGYEAGVLSYKDEDVRTLRYLVIYGLKGIAAYVHHAAALGYVDEEVLLLVQRALAATLDESLTTDQLTDWVFQVGHAGVKVMALLDKANTEQFGHPEITQVRLAPGTAPGILLSGHDLADLRDILDQTKGTGVDVYTHGEMLPAHAYPFFKQYDNFRGNYGSSWWHQPEDFEKFNGAVLMTSNCLVPPRDSYKDRLFTTGVVGFPGVAHVADRAAGKQKDFSAVIARAKQCQAPVKLADGTLTIGFARNQVLALADKVIAAVKGGAIKRFVVMAGCDGRHKSRQYFTDFAQALPQDAVILTAGCAKYRYNGLDLGDIGGIPRVLDAGQCNDSYSLVMIALALKDAFGLKDVNQLPLSFDIAWYEQKAALILLSLLALGVRNIHLGPTLPAFVSPNVLKILVDKFNIQPTTTVELDLPLVMAGK
ncbi:MAG: hydroxylamine reductase [Candidatus Edwardsbacteria bacterium]|jgi:hydroxylamine reductase|nr:hydroxylamine reductase [Candidatus Edwardsbacteria bacterium]